MSTVSESLSQMSYSWVTNAPIFKKAAFLVYMSILHRDSSYEHFSGSFEVDYNNYVEKRDVSY